MTDHCKCDGTRSMDAEGFAVHLMGCPEREPDKARQITVIALARATQALKDAAVAYATRPNAVTRYALHRAAEDYAEAYLRG